jgi:hypothetical protein
MKRLIPYIPLIIFIWGCSNTSNKLDTPEISDTQRQREVCLDWYGYRIDTKKAINDLNLKIETESELMTYCDFFKNVADTK